MDSILTSIKKLLGITEEYEHFDPDIIMHINSVFSVLTQLGSTKEKIEKEILEKQKELIEAKTQNLQSAKRVEELYTNALNAMRHYSGAGGDEDEC